MPVTRPGIAGRPPDADHRGNFLIAHRQPTAELFEGSEGGGLGRSYNGVGSRWSNRMPLVNHNRVDHMRAALTDGCCDPACIDRA